MTSLATATLEPSVSLLPDSHVMHPASDTLVPLSWEQEQIWLHGMLSPDLPLYTETIAILYRGELDLSALESSLEALCRRHEIWRTTIKETGGTPHQVVGPAVPIKVERFDFAALSELERNQQVEGLLAERARLPFDLARAPLIRAFAVRYSNEETRIFLTLHHLIFDGASLRQIVLPELVKLYTAFSAGHDSLLPMPGLQYADYASQQRANAASPRAAAMAFWRSKMEGFSPLSLPTDRPQTPQTSRRGAVHAFSFDEALTDAVLQMSRRERTTAFSVLLGAFIVLLARSSDTLDVTLGTVYGGRARTELESVLGCFLNILLLRTDLTQDPSFRDLLARIREVTLDALENADAPFHEVVREALPRTSSGGSPVQAVFSFQPPSADLPAEWDLDVFAGFNGCAKFDLHMEVEQKHGAFRGRLMYNTDLFDAATIESMVQHWTNLIRAAITAPETCIWKLPLLGAAEQNWLLDTVNESKAEIPQLCMHDLFAQKAAEVPESIAISCQGRTLTYKQLDEWSASIAIHLGELGFGGGSVIGLMVERSPEMVAGLLGVLRAGATYVPLDSTYPTARLEHMMRGSGAGLLLTQHDLVDRLPDVHLPVVTISECLSNSAQRQRASSSLPRVAVSTSAYIIFTSGSTGVPKGVEIQHLALTNFLCSMRDTPGIKPDDVLLAVTSICFDIAGLELFLPLIAGARIELATAEEATDPELLSQKLLQSGATIMQATPATWRMLIDNGWECRRPIKLLCGGEALTRTLARQLQQRSGSLWNMYGPTETTIWSACVQVGTDLSQIPLGAPIANTGLYVLDAHKALVPAGVSGELYIGGTGLAKGYCRQPDRTSERFPLVSLRDGAFTRLYRTGDRVKRLRDGSLLFLGRTDRQIKLNGFRIELGEVEQVLNALPGVQESIVVQRHHPSRGNILASFVVPKSGVSLQVEELRSHLATKLPKYMQPALLHVLKDVPLTLNGKLDRSRLPDFVVHEQSTESEQPRAGAEQTIAAIWREVLGLKSVGRQDNFFDLGGHSLEAVRCVSIANRTFNRKTTFASFLQGPTIAQFAEIVQGGATPKTQLLKQGSAKGKQLLWIGIEPWLTRFARHLRDDLTLYTITPNVDALTKDGPECTIEALADQIVRNVREVQAEGPYLLGGFCLRSLLAYEIAQRLQQDGEEVALLVLGDLYAPGRKPQWTRAQRIIRRIHRESCNLSDVLRSSVAQWLPELNRLAASWFRLITDRSDEPEVPCELLQALYVAELRYDLAPFSGKVVFLESGESSLLQPTTSGSWKGLIDNVEVLSYPGIHENLFSESQLRVFAGKIGHSIDRAFGQDDHRNSRHDNQLHKTLVPLHGGFSR